MLKFLRKYNKILLVVFGAFLMVAFLAPQAIQQLGQLNDRKIGELDGEPIMRSDLQQASAELSALDTVTPLITRFIIPLDRGSTSDRAVQWLLLTREAEQGGFYGSDLDGQTWLPDLATLLAETQAQQQGIQLTPEQQGERRQQALDFLVQQVPRARRPKMLETEQEIYQVIAKARGVFRLFRTYQFAPRLSGTRLVSEAARLSNAAAADLLVLDARSFTAGVPEPTEAEIQAHFEQYKDTPRGQGDYSMGYRLPRGVTLEWLTLDNAAIRALVEIDPVDSRKHYERNRDLYPADYAGERARIRDDLTARKVEEVFNEADRTIRAEVLRTLSGVGEDGAYRVLPDDWADRRVSYEQLAQLVVDRIRDAHGITIPLPEVNRRASEVLTQQDLLALPGIGRSGVRIGANVVAFAAAAFQARELDANADFQLQVGLTAMEKPSQDQAGNRYYYRLLEAREEQAPETLDAELRKRVIDDLRAIAAYELLASEAETYRTSLANADFDAVKTLLPEGVAPGVQPSVVIRRTGANSPSLALRDPDLSVSLVDQAYRLDPLQPLEDQPAEYAAIAGSSPLALSVVVGKVTSLQPLTDELYRLQRGQIAQTLMQRDLQTEGVPPVFSLERLMERHGYVSMDEDG